MDTVYVPHMHLFNSFNIIKAYNPRAIFAYLEDPNSPIPDCLSKSVFWCSDAIFRSYDTHELVKSLAEGDYFRANDKDAPSYLMQNSTIISSPTTSKGLMQRLTANRSV
jgi:hypothetical protein